MQFHPDYEFEDQHALINVQGAMKEDSSINTRSLSSDGPNLFDTITYSKGAYIAVLHLETFKTFGKGNNRQTSYRENHDQITQC